MESTDRVIHRIEEILRDVLADWPAEWIRFNWPGYTYEHTFRVCNLALTLARQLGANERVVHLAALLHDIGKPAGEPHAVPSAERAEPVMAQLGIDALTRQRVGHAIANHITKDPLHPLENLCLYDADLIDANFGYIAFTRFISIRAGRASTAEETIREAEGWVKRVDERREGVITGPGQVIAARRYARMLEMYDQLARDLEAGEGPALGIARYLTAYAARPSLARQMVEMERVLDGDGVAHLELSLYLREFLAMLSAEVAGQE